MITQASAAAVAAPPQVKAKEVSCGAQHTLVVDVAGKVFGCGSNEHGQLGNGTKSAAETALVPATGLLEKVGQVAAGHAHSLILTESGKVLATGFNHKGQLGNGTRHSESVPIEIDTQGVRFRSVHASHFSAGVSRDADLFLWGENPSFGETLSPTKEIKLGNIISIGLGERFAVVADAQGAVFTWGSGQQGELGIGSYDNIEEPEQVGQLEAKQTTQVAAGNNHVIALGQHILPSVRSTPVPVPVTVSQQAAAPEPVQPAPVASSYQTRSSVGQQHQSSVSQGGLAPPAPAALN